MWRVKNNAITIGEDEHEGYEVYLSLWYDYEKPSHNLILIRKVKGISERILFNVSAEDINNYFKDGK